MNQFTVCQEPGCPQPVHAFGCWCFEHLKHCDRLVDCTHGAHRCEAPVHFCPEHGGPEHDDDDDDEWAVL